MHAPTDWPAEFRVAVSRPPTRNACAVSMSPSGTCDRTAARPPLTPPFAKASSGNRWASLRDGCRRYRGIGFRSDQRRSRLMSVVSCPTRSLLRLFHGQGNAFATPAVRCPSRSKALTLASRPGPASKASGARESGVHGGTCRCWGAPTRSHGLDGPPAMEEIGLADGDIVVSAPRARYQPERSPVQSEHY